MTHISRITLTAVAVDLLLNFFNTQSNLRQNENAVVTLMMCRKYLKYVINTVPLQLKTFLKSKYFTIFTKLHEIQYSMSTLFNFRISDGYFGIVWAIMTWHNSSKTLTTDHGCEIYVYYNCENLVLVLKLYDADLFATYTPKGHLYSKFFFRIKLHKITF